MTTISFYCVCTSSTISSKAHHFENVCKSSTCFRNLRARKVVLKIENLMATYEIHFLTKARALKAKGQFINYLTRFFYI